LLIRSFTYTTNRRGLSGQRSIIFLRAEKELVPTGEVRDPSLLHVNQLGTVEKSEIRISKPEGNPKSHGCKPPVETKCQPIFPALEAESSAGFQPAVSQDFILQTGGKCQIDGGYVGRPAD
jgi:hypothetical protein